MGISIKILDSPDDLAQFFAEDLVSRIKTISSDKSFSLVLSGGSTPQRIFRKMAATAKESIAWEKVQIFWGDERCVGPAHEDSNYKMARENLLDFIPLPSSNVFRIYGEADPQVEAQRYSNMFSVYVPSYLGIPSASLFMLGLGEDGHTASIFPGDSESLHSDKLFTASVHPLNKQKRITASMKLINNAKTIIILATGESKAAKVAEIYHHLPGWELLPASWVVPVHGELIWLLDRAAASKL